MKIICVHICLTSFFVISILHWVLYTSSQIIIKVHIRNHAVSKCEGFLYPRIMNQNFMFFSMNFSALDFFRLDVIGTNILSIFVLIVFDVNFLQTISYPIDINFLFGMSIFMESLKLNVCRQK